MLIWVSPLASSVRVKVLLPMRVPADPTPMSADVVVGLAANAGAAAPTTTPAPRTAAAAVRVKSFLNTVPPVLVDGKGTTAPAALVHEQAGPQEPGQPDRTHGPDGNGRAVLKERRVAAPCPLRRGHGHIHVAERGPARDVELGDEGGERPLLVRTERHAGAEAAVVEDSYVPQGAGAVFGTSPEDVAFHGGEGERLVGEVDHRDVT